MNFPKRFEGYNHRVVQQQMKLISGWLFCEVFADFCIGSFFVLTILVIVWESVRNLDGLKAPDYLSSYAVHLLKENFVVF